MSGSTYKGVPVPEGLIPNWDASEASWWMRGVQAAVDTVRPLLEDLLDSEACALDPSGVCQTHWGNLLGGECPVVVAREFLEASGPEAVWRSTVVIDPYLYWCLVHRPALAVTEVRLADIHPSVEIQCVQCGRSAR